MSRIAKIFVAFAAAVALIFSGVLPASAALAPQYVNDPIDSAGISDITEVDVEGADDRPGRIFVYLTFNSIVYDWHFQEDVWASVGFDVNDDGIEDYYVASGYDPLSSIGQTVEVRNSSNFTATGCTANFFGFPLDREDYVGWNIDDNCLGLPDAFGVQGYVRDSRDNTYDFAPNFDFFNVQNPSSGALPSLSITTRPRISGTPQPGYKLSAVTGSWNSGVSFEYQWYLDGESIPGETGSYYMPQASDVGSQVTVEVTGSKAGYSSTTLTSLGVAITSPPKVRGATPTISGATKLGSTLTAKPGSWTSGTAFTYQWKRNGAAIAGATKSTYKTSAADKGKKITVTVTGRKSGYISVSLTSAAKLITK